MKIWILIISFLIKDQTIFSSKIHYLMLQVVSKQIWLSKIGEIEQILKHIGQINHRLSMPFEILSDFKLILQLICESDSCAQLFFKTDLP